MDILRDEALVYADKLKESRTEVRTYVVPGGYHGFDPDRTNSLVQEMDRKTLLEKSGQSAGV